MRSIAPSARGELEITDAIQWLIDNGHRVRTEQLTGWWIDTGKLTPLLEANRLLLETVETRDRGRRRRGDQPRRPGRHRGRCDVRRSRIRGPVAIAAGTDDRRTASSARSRPSASDCAVINSEIEHSVVMAGSSIVDIPRLEDSLIGREAVITRSQARPRALRLMVGDHCQVDVE